MVAELKKFADNLNDSKDDARHLLEALWVAQQHNHIDTRLLKRVLTSNDPRARAAATRVVCYWRDQLDNPLELLAQRAEDENLRVQLEVIRACSFFTDDAEAAAEVALTVDPADDYYLNYTMKETMNMLEQYLE